MAIKAVSNLFRQGTLLFASTLLVNLGNYLINLLLGRWMGPAEFSEVGLLVTILLMLSFIALAFQLTAAKYTALWLGSEPEKLSALYSWLKRVGWYTGFCMSAVFIVFPLSLQNFFRTSSWWFFPVFGVGIPLYLIMSINRGILQGEQSYGRLALTYQVEMWCRLGLSIIAVRLGWGTPGIAVAITLSLFATLLVSGTRIKAIRVGLEESRAILRFFFIILIYECSQILINNSDTMLVKHFFPPTQAGLYAALALIGRIVYFGTWTVVTLLFPLVIRLEKEGKPHLPYFYGGLGIVAALATLIITGAYLFPVWMVQLLFGSEYLSISPFLWKYALATALFTCANVFVYYNISLGRNLPALLMVLAGFLQIGLIWIWHTSFDQVIGIQIGLMIGIIILMMVVQARKWVVLTAGCLGTLFCHGQETLKPGFSMLETGKFKEATVFFRDYLQKDPDNRTALLCYGRATGLSGNVGEAKDVFQRLEQRYPGDFEIRLNAAEAFMWEKDFKSGKQAYAELIREQPGSFPATLGYGNAYASLLQYDSALVYINKALTLQPGNANAKLSLKYIRLGLADKYAQQQRYTSAAQLLEQNLAERPGDKESLFAKGQLLLSQKEYASAIAIFDTLIGRKQDVVNASLSLSYALYLQKKKRSALEVADNAVAAADTGSYLRARLGRVTALGWNNQFPLAFKELDSLEQLYPHHPDISLKRAMLLAAQKNFGRSLELFKTVLMQRPSSFDANLGSADVLFAQELDKISRQYVNATLSFYPGQKDAKEFMERLDLRHAPAVYTLDYHSSDKGGNISNNYSAGFSFDLLSPLRISFDFKTRDVKNKLDGSHANNDNYTIGARWRINPFCLVTAALNETVLRGDSSHSHLLADVGAEFKFARWHTLELRYRSDVQNFTAGLIDSNITMNNVMLTYNLSTPMRLGLYSQLIYTSFSDGNKRDLLFASLYYNFLNDPVVKAGINFNDMHFKLQLPTKYFSPDQFTSYELFASIENLDIPKKKWLYQALFAGGTQKIDASGAQGIYRLNLSLGYRPVPNFNASVYYLHSNSASSTVAGYTYTEWGVKARWVIKRLYRR